MRLTPERQVLDVKAAVDREAVEVRLRDDHLQRVTSLGVGRKSTAESLVSDHW